MRDFGPWIHDRQQSDPAFAVLKQAAKDHAGDWPYYSNDPASYSSFASAHVPAADRDKVLVLLGQLFAAWQAEGERSTARPGFWARVVDRLGTIALIGFGVIFAGAIGYALYQSDFLAALADPDRARGLITFLVAIATISVAVLTSICIFYVSGTELENRYSKAKDLLAVLVGILGTILGFYFGSADKTPSPPEPVANADTQEAGGSGGSVGGEAPPATPPPPAETPAGN
jgi:hypothetical protein